MVLTIRCQKCRNTIHKEVHPGYSIGPILECYGWTAIPSGYLCGECMSVGGPSLRAFADMLKADEICRK
jgi:hypothetical protein